MKSASHEQIHAAESMGASRWQVVLHARNFRRTDIVVMGIFVIGSVAYLFDLLMRHLERRFVLCRGRG